jgi:hypothetical protein
VALVVPSGAAASHRIAPPKPVVHYAHHARHYFGASYVRWIHCHGRRHHPRRWCWVEYAGLKPPANPLDADVFAVDERVLALQVGGHRWRVWSDLLSVGDPPY